MLGNIVVITLIGLTITDMIIMFFYCRFMEILEKKREAQRKENNRTNDAKRDKENIGTSRTLKKIAGSIIDHFLYGLMRYSVLLAGRIPSGHIRNWIYRYIFNAKITGKTVINGGVEIRSPWNLKAGNCIIMNNCILDARSRIEIADNVVFGVGVHIWTEEHDVNSPIFAVNEENRGAVIIDNHAWICSDTTILPKIHIGEGAVLAARACATKDLEPYGIYAGIPAKKISERKHELTYELSGKAHWHFY